MPVHVVETVSKLRRREQGLMQELGRDATDAELAEAMAVSVEKIEYVRQVAREAVSLETPVGEDGDVQLGDFVEDPNGVPMEDGVMAEMLGEKLREALDALGERESRILRLRYGLDDGRPRTLAEVGQFPHVKQRKSGSAPHAGGGGRGVRVDAGADPPD